MIDRVSGTVQAIHKNAITINVGAIGFLLQVPNTAFYGLKAEKDMALPINQCINLERCEQTMYALMHKMEKCPGRPTNDSEGSLKFEKLHTFRTKFSRRQKEDVVADRLLKQFSDELVVEKNPAQAPRRLLKMIARNKGEKLEEEEQGWMCYLTFGAVTYWEE